MNGIPYDEMPRYIEQYLEEIEELRKENKHLQEQLDNALKMYDEELEKNKKAIKFLKSIPLDNMDIVFMFKRDETLEILYGGDKE